MGLEIGERVDRHRGRWDLSEHSEPSRRKINFQAYILMEERWHA